MTDNLTSGEDTMSAKEMNNGLRMPPAIAQAIVAVMSEVKKLGKEGTNTFQRYKFTSVDQFYEVLGPLMASRGLFDVAFERSSQVEVREAVDDRGQTKKSAWLTAEIDFWLFHESGASFGPIARHIQVPATGAQSYASAQSYAEKYFLRNLFKVPTGDIDEIESSEASGLPQTMSDRLIPAEKELDAAARDGLKPLELAWRKLDPELKVVLEAKVKKLAAEIKARTA